ncbi:MAG: DUF1822 family protein (plasmid) [Leptolyngbya sp. BL-A-14]
MNPSLLNVDNTLDLQERTMALEAEHFDWAVRVSNSLPTEERQWRAYLNLLALVGFKEWLSQRAPDLAVQADGCSILSPPLANVIDAVCNLAIGEFRVCLLVMERRDHGTVSVPRAVIDLPEFTAHFYVLVEVLEEQAEAMIHSVLSYDQLRQQQTAQALQPQPDWTYLLPLHWFALDLTAMIVALRCGDLYQFSLPKAPARLVFLNRYKDSVAATLSANGKIERPLWEVLSWEEGTVLLTTPGLARWFYQQQRQPAANAEATLLTLLNNLTQSAVNGWYWMQETLDDLALRWRWTLQPALTPAGAMRGNVSDTSKEITRRPYENVVTFLNEKGIKLPPQEHNAWMDLELGNERLRLRAIPIPSISSEENQESVAQWGLFVLLEAQPGCTLPQGATLQMSDETEVLNEQSFDQDTEDAFLFSCVAGDRHEQFVVTIKLANGLSLSLPPFAFQPEPQP